MAKKRPRRQHAARPDPVQERLADWLFLRTLDDIELHLKTPQDRYSLLGIAPLLRKLFVDGDRLVERVNRKSRLSLQFVTHEAVRPAVELGGETRFWAQGAAVIPGHDSSPLAFCESASAWMAHITGEAGGRPLRVRDIIKHCAHVEGGVHLGRPSSVQEAAMFGLVHALLDDNLPSEVLAGSPVGALSPIATVSLAGLSTLRDAVRERSSGA
ncbi:hypothetical protein [Nocardioides bruguierae]|uniref:hypothetical protein n=1 Tax=Nocardioides bruguierae TaxID=2945102 RepID=UPI0020221AF2|nr:hypothetical protein [Nocardioides bruguierae]MCL8026303.1 hypothetical protein [Nocardioides bruguierae]